MNRFKPLLLLLAGAAPLAVWSETRASGTQLAIAAAVAKFASVGVHGAPTELVVTAADVARGFVDIAEGGRVEVRSNSREGVRLEFLNRSSEWVRAIEVSGLPGGALAGAVRGVSNRTLPVGYRILLAPNAQPGVYAWPVGVVAAPL